MEGFDDIDMNAMLDEIEEESKDFAKPKIAMKKVLIDVNVPFLDIDGPTKESPKTGDKVKAPPMKDQNPKSESVVHAGDTDSSEDEENKYFEEQTYNSCGSDLRKLMKKTSGGSSSFTPTVSPKVPEKSKPTKSPNHYVFGLSSDPVKKPASEDKQSANKNFDSYRDPIFGLSIVNPLLSSATMKARMTGRTPVSFFKLKNHVEHGDLKTDWVIGGVLVNKSPTRVSQKGNKYMIWTLSDLKTGLLTASLFLFRRAYDQLWKTQAGAVIGVLNPSPLSQNEKSGKSKDQAQLSINDPDQVMMLGRSKDLGTCKGKKKDGSECQAFVNARECGFCNYHVASAYRDYKGRAELQSPTCGSMKSLQNKVLGKNEVFYGGKSYVAQPTKGSSKKVLEQDKKRLVNLGGLGPKEPAKPLDPLSANQLSARSVSLLNMLGKSTSSNKPSSTLESKDAKRLSTLSTSSKTESPTTSKQSVKLQKSSTLVPPKLKNPELSNPEGEFIEFDIPAPKPITKKLDTKQLCTSNNKTTKRSVEKKSQNKFNSLINLKSDSPKDATSGYSLKTEKSVSAVSSIVSTLEKEKRNVSVTDAKMTGEDEENIKKLQERSPSTVNALPVKGEETIRIMVDTVTRSPTSRLSKAKLRALQVVKKNGGITRENPRGVTREEVVNRGLKRQFQEEEDDAKEELKNSVLSARFLELMSMESKHSDLLEAFDRQVEDAYYEKLEKKEQMEEKMMSIYKLECKAVRCMKCRYTWFSASDACKADRHPLKVVDALKRFFKCNDCGNRTVSLSILPLLPCKKCSSTSWVKTAMMKERIVKNSHELSIRGGEQKYINSVATNTSINLLVPE
uniref:Protein MCM10 homolog n=2 Tax=Lygus hesperus TaxID=30085 RepID=A0A146LL27_LYGHE